MSCLILLTFYPFGIIEKRYRIDGFCDGFFKNELFRPLFANGRLVVCGGDFFRSLLDRFSEYFFDCRVCILAVKWADCHSCEADDSQSSLCCPFMFCSSFNRLHQLGNAIHVIGVRWYQNVQKIIVFLCSIRHLLVFTPMERTTVNRFIYINSFNGVSEYLCSDRCTWFS